MKPAVFVSQTLVKNQTLIPTGVLEEFCYHLPLGQNSDRKIVDTDRTFFGICQLHRSVADDSGILKELQIKSKAIWILWSKFFKNSIKQFVSANVQVKQTKNFRFSYKKWIEWELLPFLSKAKIWCKSRGKYFISLGPRV